MLARLARSFYGLALISLPWVGVGVLRLTTGRDWGWGLQPSWLFLAVAYLLMVADRVSRGSLRTDLGRMARDTMPRWWVRGGGIVLVAVMISSIGLRTAASGVPMEEAVARFAKQVVQLGIMVAFVVYPALWTRGPDRWAWTIRMVMIGAMIQAGYGLLQAVEYYQPLGILAPLEKVATSNPAILAGSHDLYLDGRMHEIPRLRGTACEPLYLGNYLLMVLPLVFLFPRGRGRIVLGVATLVLLFGTWSRGAWLGLAGSVAVALILLVYSRKWGGSVLPGQKPLVRILAGAAGALVVLTVAAWVWDIEALLLPWERLGQVFSRQDWSNLTRIYSMQAGWRAFQLSPVVGVGWGQFGFHFPALVDPLGLQSQFTWPVVNNFPLLILCETGLIGFAAFFGLLTVLWQGVLRGLADPGRAAMRWRLVATGAGFAGVWLQLLTFSQYNLPHIWVVLGLVLAATADNPLRREGAGS